MKVKTKITLGLVFLFSVIVVLGIITIHYLNLLTNQNQNLLRENYQSLEYTHELLNSLNDIRNSFEPDDNSRVTLNKVDFKLQSSIARFEESLEKQRGVSKEEGEIQLVNEVQNEFEALKEYLEVTRTKDYYFEKLLPVLEDLSLNIDQIYRLNEQTINHRTQMAEATADRVIYTVAGIIVFCILIAFSFMVRFPSYVAEPVDKFSTAIDKMSQGDYSARVDIDTRDEFGKLGLAFNDMASRMDEFERLNLSKLMTEKKRMETMIQKISEGIIGLDAEFNVLFINPFAKKLLGISRQKIKGLSAKDLSLQNPIFQNTIQDLLESSITSDRRYTRNKLIKGNLDNKTAYFIRKVIITYADSDDDHELNGYIIMLKNITEYKEMDQAKTNFIATVSHELKTPISAIKMSLRLLKDQRLGRLEEEQEEMVESIEWETNRLLNITQELLNATEMEGGEIKLNLEPTRPEDIVEEAIDSVITLAEDRNVIIEKEVDSNLPNILVDEDKVTWVLVNFLTNSIKYSPVGSRVDIKVTYDQEFIEFSVKDQGTGIPEEHQKRIFDRYYRIPGSGGKGTGLGLSISKELINKMGGKIGLESNPGKGARFYFRLFETSVNEVPLNKRA
ncbi:MAG: hypothetical protein CMI36_10720 [Owenweeksia sp.]|nr:hypothetical protein [Owenweeksia sp.]MBF99454.1 hypothetical protein [Owenweeksia sp.]|tara:strand:+ start:2593 stop:4446 length:1854 start_codon:yes stop_codon:yes gene_type:complete